MTLASKYCTRCCTTKILSEYYTRKVDGITYPYHICKECDKAEKRSRYNPQKAKIKRASRDVEKEAQAKRLSRAEPMNRERYIVEDTRKADKRKGHENDLDREFVRDLIDHGCEYCGDTTNRLNMTLDRINNRIGHVKANVRPACYRCNILKQDMPDDAWLSIVPAVRGAHEAGLFADWRGSPMRPRTG